MPYRGMQPTCSGFLTGTLQQEIRKKDGEAMTRKRAEAPKNKKNKDSEGLQWQEFLNFTSCILLGNDVLANITRKGTK
jgi:hypothetical protein